MNNSIQHPNLLSIMMLACAGVLPAFVFLVAPVFVGGLVETGMAVDQAGFLLSAELGGFAVGGLIATLCLKNTQWTRIVFVALWMMISGNLASAYISGSHESSYEVLMWVRVMCGLGSGSLAAIINIALSKAQNSDRAFAYLLFAQLSFSALGIYLFPNFIASVGSVNVIFYVLAGLCVLVFAAAPIWTRKLSISISPVTSSSDTSSTRSIVILLSVCTMFFFYAGENAVWAFLEVIAEEGGIANSDIGALLGTIGLAGLAGAACAVVQAEKLGRLFPILLTIGIQVVVVILLQGNLETMPFLYLASIFNFLWNYCAPYLFAVVADSDSSGRAVALSIPALGAGLTAGPLVVGVLLPSFGLSIVNTIAIVALVLSAIAVLPLIRNSEAFKAETAS
ncbi:hypothetical protein CW749_26555 [Vibrio sp. vnigr-6D03]|uniref:MFS transporter n=1 Tax=Vibrio sp. vnigr-6D03 TaxID=2058088 RepID=UPI000C329158|nr:MFS transporter [Vibrio sp. vnigr-6D03]PKF76490.1 hypothetical protein CW749_26555 [Vibrio sp. vnigr-6D03]